jgi:hypothetical protein
LDRLLQAHKDFVKFEEDENNSILRGLEFLSSGAASEFSGLTVSGDTGFTYAHGKSFYISATICQLHLIEFPFCFVAEQCSEVSERSRKPSTPTSEWSLHVDSVNDVFLTGQPCMVFVFEMW